MYPFISGAQKIGLFLVLSLGLCVLYPALASAQCSGLFYPNGIIDILIEECDDGNMIDDDGCTNDCTVSYCGDGIVTAGIGETCDDGNRHDADGCDHRCQSEVCGNGIAGYSIREVPPYWNNGYSLEECDDGNGTKGDGCTNCYLDPVVDITTSPPGAQVYVGGSGFYRGTLVGTTPITGQRMTAGRYRFLFVKNGYAYVEREIYVRDVTRTIDVTLMPPHAETFTTAAALDGPAGGPIQHVGPASPTLGTLDCDETLDLVVGSGDGQVYFYPNSSERGLVLDQPMVALMETGPTPISVGANARPTLIDLDGDLRTDLLIGNDAGEIWYYRNISVDCNEAPLFDSGVVQYVMGTSQLVSSNASPMLADFTMDGKKDLIVGGGGGEVKVFENIGTDTAPTWNAGYEFLNTAGVPAHPQIVDFDFDEDPDLLVSTAGGNLALYTNSDASLGYQSYSFLGPFVLGGVQYATPFSLNLGTNLDFTYSDSVFDYWRQRDVVWGNDAGEVGLVKAVHLQGDPNADRYANGLDVIGANMRLGQTDPAPEDDGKYDTPAEDPSVEAGLVDQVVDASDRDGIAAKFGQDYTPPVCGNGLIEQGEDCDFGDTLPGDGCDPVCLWECGNGVIDSALETCDDGNRVNGDGCNGDCKSECGNGSLDPGETCDGKGLCVGSTSCDDDNSCAAGWLCAQTPIGNRCARINDYCTNDSWCDPTETCQPANLGYCTIDCDTTGSLVERPTDFLYCGSGDHFNILDANWTGQGPILSAWVEFEAPTAPAGDFGTVLNAYIDVDQSASSGNVDLGITSLGSPDTSNFIGWEYKISCDVSVTSGTNVDASCTFFPALIPVPVKFVTMPKGGINFEALFAVDLRAANLLGVGFPPVPPIPPLNYVLEFAQTGLDNYVCDRFPDIGFGTLSDAQRCGNLVTEPGEECDDGNRLAGDGCAPWCLFEVCGNGLLDQWEWCDDGNTQGGDGCAADCSGP